MTKTNKRRKAATEEAPAGAPETAPAVTADATKIQQVVAALRSPDGARVEELMELTGWQAHSVRGAMSGAIKKKLGLTITSEKVDGVRIYRIAGVAA